MKLNIRIPVIVGPGLCWYAQLASHNAPLSAPEVFSNQRVVVVSAFVDIHDVEEIPGDVLEQAQAEETIHDKLRRLETACENLANDNNSLRTQLEAAEALLAAAERRVSGEDPPF